MLPGTAARSHPETDPTACFSIHAAAEPGVMPRVLALFAKRGLVPSSWVSRVSGRDLVIDVQMRGLDPASAAYMAQCLRQIVSVNAVLTSEKR
jgi:acetolactate synthase small subunit